MTAPVQNARPLDIVRAGRHKAFHFRARKFGRNDIQEYQSLSRDISIGSSEIGLVSVDCRFIFSKTRLGILEHKDDPGGIIYMEITINQPSDWSLKEANISIILDDAEQRSTRKRIRQEKSIEFYQDCYGPRYLVGPELAAETIKNHSISPQFEAMGFGASFGEIGSSTTQPRTSWWNFRGTPKPDNAQTHQYTKLTWTMSPNSQAYTVDHPPKIPTAFAFSHKYQPFFLRVEIDGKLRHRYQRCKDKAIGLFTKAKRENPIILLFNLDPKDQHTTSIIEQARGLEKEMIKIACQDQFIEVSPRGSSTKFLADKGPHAQKPNEHVHMLRGVERPALSPKQIDLISRLQKAHNTLVKDEPLQIFPRTPPLEPGSVEEKAISRPVKQMSPEELAKTLNSMPPLMLWMLNFLIQLIGAISKSEVKEKKE